MKEPEPEFRLYVSYDFNSLVTPSVNAGRADDDLRARVDSNHALARAGSNRRTAAYKQPAAARKPPAAVRTAARGYKPREAARADILEVVAR